MVLLPLPNELVFTTGPPKPECVAILLAMPKSPLAARVSYRRADIFAVVLAVLQQQQPCRVHSAVQSLRAVGWRDDIVCLHGDGFAGDEALVGCTRAVAVPPIKLTHKVRTGMP